MKEYSEEEEEERRKSLEEYSVELDFIEQTHILRALYYAQCEMDNACYNNFC